MNIFILDANPEAAAAMACDKHVVKMILETAQMLCTVARDMGYEGAPYRSTHKNHPCTVWAAKTSSNWSWLLRHGFALCDEYTKRYGKNHKSSVLLEKNLAPTNMNIKELATLVGSSSESTSRAIHELKQSGVIKLKHQSICLLGLASRTRQITFRNI